MDKSEIMANFREMLERRFPNRPTPISKDVKDIEPKVYNDSKFENWREKQ